MTPSQKLTTVLEYAVKKGFTFLSEDEPEIIISSVKSETHNISCVYQIIFDHDFAKAVYGDEKTKTSTCWGCNTGEVQRRHQACQCRYEIAWKHHLQNQVLSPDPIDYLYQFVKEQV